MPENFHMAGLGDWANDVLGRTIAYLWYALGYRNVNFKVRVNFHAVNKT
jgi:hypothetical protein